MAHKLKEKEEKEEFFLDVVGLIQKREGFFLLFIKAPLIHCLFVIFVKSLTVGIL